MDWKLELVVVPVSDVERSKRFYSEQVGFAVDHDTRVTDDMHIVQLTPPVRRTWAPRGQTPVKPASPSRSYVASATRSTPTSKHSSPS